MTSVTTTTKKARNTNEVAQIRIKFIIENFPEVLECNPYLDLPLVDRIKRALFSAGLYSSFGDCTNPSTDSAIINYIRKIQSKPVLKRYISSRIKKTDPGIYAI